MNNLPGTQIIQIAQSVLTPQISAQQFSGASASASATIGTIGYEIEQAAFALQRAGNMLNSAMIRHGQPAITFPTIPSADPNWDDEYLLCWLLNLLLLVIRWYKCVNDPATTVAEKQTCVDAKHTQFLADILDCPSQPVEE